MGADPRDLVGLRPVETELVGAFLTTSGKIVPDAVCVRIQQLVEGRLEPVAVDASGWDRLHRDPTDGRLWELTYPESEMHGGGPPRLCVISPADATAKYGRCF
jgi:Immunity protein 27